MEDGLTGGKRKTDVILKNFNAKMFLGGTKTNQTNYEQERGECFRIGNVDIFDDSDSVWLLA
jgi:hypothetical protein